MYTTRAFLLCTTMVLLLTEESQQLSPSKSVRARRFRGKGGWTLNSVGYNGGVGALRKLFGKRDGSAIPAYNPAEEVVEEPYGGDENSKYLDELVDEFLSYLEWKESGKLRNEVLGSLASKFQDEGQDSQEDPFLGQYE